MYQIEGKLKDKLLALIDAALPRETGGLIVDGTKVVELENHADKNSAFEFHKEDIRYWFQYYSVDPLEANDRVILWHSHPGGGVGPSREDMRNRTPLRHHLVLSYVKDDIVPTWY